MAMCFRMCLTNNASNSIPITAPPGYTAGALELLRREITAATAAGIKLGQLVPKQHHTPCTQP